MRRKTFQVLRYLVARPGQLVTKEALLDGVWGEVAVSDSMPSICIAELRKALGDDPRTPSLIETVHGRGYRFIAQFRPTLASLSVAPAAPALLMVGRDEELAQIREWFARASQGSRRVVFVTGEPGIGKTTFARSFLAELASKRLARIGCGQCVEQYGAGEPYMPMLEALTRLAQEPDGDLLVEILRRLAPTWLAQMPALVTPEERVKLQSEMQVVTQQRMLREMAEALEALAAEMPLVLLLEDLHWSDFSTLELVSVIARRNEAARLLIIGSYRPVEMLASEHRLRAMKEELELHQQCEELQLKLLSERDVGAYIRLRFADEDPAGLLEQAAPMIHQRTEGNPLFMVNVVDYLVEQGSLLGAGKIEAPHTITQMIERNLDRQKPEEQTILEAASVAGAEFSAAAVAGALQQEIGEVESCCARLARHEQFVASQGAITWPDGTVASGFRFHHALYQEVLYHRVPAGRRVQLHCRIAERQETAWGDRAAEIAAELAYHFERSGSVRKAAEYLGQAGTRAARQVAHAEAVGYFTRALELLRALPDSAGRNAQELDLQMALSWSLFVATGPRTGERESALVRARELSEELGDTAKLMEALLALAHLRANQSELELARELAKRVLAMAEPAEAPAMLAEAHGVLGVVRFSSGQFPAAREHLERAVKLFGVLPLRNYGAYIAQNSPNLLVAVLMISGYPLTALSRARELLPAAGRRSDPYSVVTGLFSDCMHHIVLRDTRMVAERAQQILSIAAEHEMPFLSLAANFFRGWASAAAGRAEEGIAEMHRSLSDPILAEAASAALMLVALAESCGNNGRTQEGLAWVAKGLTTAEKTGQRVAEAELHRIKGDLLTASGLGSIAEAERCFRTAIDVARWQGAKLFELRATVSLARLLAKHGGRDEARSMLAKIYNWFTEGFDTIELREAKSLLEKLGEKLRRRPAIRFRHRQEHDHDR